MSGKRKYQASKSTSNKRLRRKRDVSYSLPHSEFLGIASTFSGLVLSLLLGITIYNNTFAASSISITLSGDVELNLARSNDGAVYGKSSEQTAHVESDHFTGYTFTIAGQDNEGSLVGKNNPANKITSITEEMSQDLFKTTANNQWGFLPDTLRKNETTITNNNYQPAPKTTPTEIDKTTSSNKADGGKDYKLAIGARVDNTMALDSYGQTFILAATGNGYDYHIGFTDDLETIPADIIGTNETSNKVTIPSTKPTKAGYIFKGWCTKPTTNDSTTCPGDTIDAGTEITLDGTNGNNYDLHTIWEPVTFAKAFNDASASMTMQNMTTSICNAVAIGQEGTLTDTRGGSYHVGKMKDGRCWMLDNLALGGSSDISLTTEDSNVTETRTLPATRTDGFTVYNEARVNTAYNDEIPSDSISQQVGGKVGTYYNYCAATAGTYCPAAGTAKDTPVTEDICPKGWRLPSSGPGGEFLALYTAYGSNYNNFRTSFRLPLSGHYNSAQVYHQGGHGYWWSSTFYNGNSIYYLYANTSGIYPQSANNRYLGFSVRCVAK